MKAEKCVFHASSVSFLGPVVSADGISMDPAKVHAVMDWLVPDTRTALQRFLGLLIFIVVLSLISARWPPLLRPLTLTKSCFTWSNAAQETFDRLKELFTSAPILITSDTSRQFIVEVDVSNVGVGAVLSQCFPQDDRIHPCDFSLITSRQQNVTTMWVTVNSLSFRWRVASLVRRGSPAIRCLD